MSADSLQRFIFDNLDVRGQWLQLEHAYQDALAHHNYPKAIKRWLGELITATTLFGNNLKFEGVITLQLRSEGPVSLLMAQCSHHQEVRAIAQFDEQIDYLDGGLQSVIKGGTLVLTVDPDQGQRYQGVVPLEQDNLANCLEDYFNQSEQLKTRIWLAADDRRAAGLLLQQLPAEQVTDAGIAEQSFEELEALTDTVKDEELLELPSEELLFRLYNEHQVRLFEAAAVEFKCKCSHSKASGAIESLGLEDALALVAERGEISIDCEFCGTVYSFNGEDVNELFGNTKGDQH